ncbi:MAG: hypothetical protein Q6K80_00915 [Thermostichus sp. DG_1_6_bins_120]
MQNATLRPIPLLQRSLELLSPIYTPLLILASPGFFIPVIAEIIPLLGGVLNLAYGVVGVPILGGAALLLVDQHLKQQPAVLGNSLDQAVSKAVPLVLGSILLGFIILGGSLLFLIPGIYLGVRLAFLPCAIALEEQGAIDGIKYSWKLVQGRWWGVFWAFLAVGLIFGIPILILSTIVGSIGAALNWRLLVVVVIGAVTVAITPIFNIFTVLLFRSLQEIQRQNP